MALLSNCLVLSSRPPLTVVTMRLDKQTKQETSWQRKLQVVATLLVAALTVAVIVSAFIPSHRGWVGFWKDESKTTTTEIDAQGKTIKTVVTIKEEQGKTLWDWLGLLGVPLSLAVFGYWLQQQQQRQATAIAQEQQRQAEAEAELKLYHERISTLLIDKNLLAIATRIDKQGRDFVPPSELEMFDAATNLIRTRTLSTLWLLRDDNERKNSVVRFLVETEIVNRLKLDLSGADLSGVNLSESNLSSVNLSNTNLSGANLFGVNLFGVNLSNTNMSGANLLGVNLSNANLSSANLRDANLSFAILNNTDLSFAILNNVNLSGADLSRADLRSANLSGANLSDADLSWVNLNLANLSSTNLHFADLGSAYLRDSNLDGVLFFQTKWPAAEEVAKAKNIPDELKKQLKLT